MDSLPLYKFLDPVGAKLTLRNGTFKHAKPSDFNDTEDLTIRGIFPCELENALQEITQNFVSIVMANLDGEPTCASPMKEKMELIQAGIKSDPQAEQILCKGLLDAEGGIFDLEHLRNVTAAFVAEINDLMQGYRVLCVTTDVASDRMWNEYAKDHTGAVVRIQPNISKDSKFQLFRKVNYKDKRPPLYDSPTQFLSDGLYGDKDKVLRSCVEKIIYTKTREWEHEREYRLVVPVLRNESPWDILPYHAEEVVELYLGANMNSCDRGEIAAYAKKRNPAMAIFIEIRESDGSVRFSRIS